MSLLRPRWGGRRKERRAEVRRVVALSAQQRSEIRAALRSLERVVSELERQAEVPKEGPK